MGNEVSTGERLITVKVVGDKVIATCGATNTNHQLTLTSSPTRGTEVNVVHDATSSNYDNNDLDMTYITERIIAMSLPSAGPESALQGHISNVAQMLKNKHDEKYLIINLSEKRADLHKLNPHVLDFGWPDRLAPPLQRMCDICKMIDLWLKADPHNVVVIHSKGGRGRIGVIIAGYLHYSNIGARDDQALDQFAMKKFYDDKLASSTQPSQRRYIHYFAGLLSGAIKINSKPLYLHHLILTVVPTMDDEGGGGGCRPFIKVYQAMKLIFMSGINVVKDSAQMCISLERPLQLRGDVLVKCYHKRLTPTREIIFRCQFHTCAISDNRLTFAKSDLDEANTDPRFPENGKVEFIFSPTSDKVYVPHFAQSISSAAVETNDLVLERSNSYENFCSLNSTNSSGTADLAGELNRVPFSSGARSRSPDTDHVLRSRSPEVVHTVKPPDDLLRSRSPEGVMWSRSQEGVLRSREVAETNSSCSNYAAPEKPKSKVTLFPDGFMSQSIDSGISSTSSGCTTGASQVSQSHSSKTRTTLTTSTAFTSSSSAAASTAASAAIVPSPIEGEAQLDEILGELLRESSFSSKRANSSRRVSEEFETSTGTITTHSGNSRTIVSWQLNTPKHGTPSTTPRQGTPTVVEQMAEERSGRQQQCLEENLKTRSSSLDNQPSGPSANDRFSRRRQYIEEVRPSEVVCYSDTEVPNERARRRLLQRLCDARPPATHNLRVGLDREPCPALPPRSETPDAYFGRREKSPTRRVNFGESEEEGSSVRHNGVPHRGYFSDSEEPLVWLEAQRRRVDRAKQSALQGRRYPTDSSKTAEPDNQRTLRVEEYRQVKMPSNESAAPVSKSGVEIATQTDLLDSSQSINDFSHFRSMPTDLENVDFTRRPKDFDRYGLHYPKFKSEQWSWEESGSSSTAPPPSTDLPPRGPSSREAVERISSLVNRRKFEQDILFGEPYSEEHYTTSSRTKESMGDPNSYSTSREYSNVRTQTSQQREQPTSKPSPNQRSPTKSQPPYSLEPALVPAKEPLVKETHARKSSLGYDSDKLYQYEYNVWETRNSTAKRQEERPSTKKEEDGAEIEHRVRAESRPQLQVPAEAEIIEDVISLQPIGVGVHNLESTGSSVRLGSGPQFRSLTPAPRRISCRSPSYSTAAYSRSACTSPEPYRQDDYRSPLHSQSTRPSPVTIIRHEATSPNQGAPSSTSQAMEGQQQATGSGQGYYGARKTRHQQQRSGTFEQRFLNEWRTLEQQPRWSKSQTNVSPSYAATLESLYDVPRHNDRPPQQSRGAATSPVRDQLQEIISEAERYDRVTTKKPADIPTQISVGNANDWSEKKSFSTEVQQRSTLGSAGRVTQPRSSPPRYIATARQVEEAAAWKEAQEATVGSSSRGHGGHVATTSQPSQVQGRIGARSPDPYVEEVRKEMHQEVRETWGSGQPTQSYEQRNTSNQEQILHQQPFVYEQQRAQANQTFQNKVSQQSYQSSSKLHQQQDLQQQLKGSGYRQQPQVQQLSQLQQLDSQRRLHSSSTPPQPSYKQAQYTQSAASGRAESRLATGANQQQAVQMIDGQSRQAATNQQTSFQNKAQLSANEGGYFEERTTFSSAMMSQQERPHQDRYQLHQHGSASNQLTVDTGQSSWQFKNGFPRSPSSPGSFLATSPSGTHLNTISRTHGYHSGSTTPLSVGPSSPSIYFGQSRRGSFASLADGFELVQTPPKFVHDTSKYWYKPTISREEAIAILRDKPPGTFIVRDSTSFPGAYGLAIKVSQVPANMPIKGVDPQAELVRHFLIETTPKGVRLKGCSNEPSFGSLPALVYQHSITQLALPCRLMLPDTPADSYKDEVDFGLSSLKLSHQYEKETACNVLFINSVDIESLTGPEALSKAVTDTLALTPPPVTTQVQLKVNQRGITVTDNKRKIFFRRYYQLSHVIFIGTDMKARRWSERNEVSSAQGALRIFGFIARKQGSPVDNVCHIFGELDPTSQPIDTVVTFVINLLIGQGAYTT